VFMRMFKQSLSEGRKQVPVSEWFKLVSSIVEVAGAKRGYSIIGVPTPMTVFRSMGNRFVGS